MLKGKYQSEKGIFFFFKKRQVVWFDAQVPVRQWNSMCIERDISRKKFRIYQNGDLVFSYGECTTVGEASGFRVTNQTCIEEEWKYVKNQKVDFIGPCTNHNWQSYWCLVNISSTDKIYNPLNDFWGECSLSCMTLNQSRDSSNPALLISYKFSPELFNSMQIGSEISTKISFKGKMSDLFIWDYPIGQKTIKKFIFCEEHDEMARAKVSWINWRDYWTLTFNGDSLIEEKSIKNHLCRRDIFRIYIGFWKQMNYESAMRHCSSFGGRLPMSDE